MSLAVVGVDFNNRDGSNRRFALAMCNPGDTIELRLEPKNPADENAVAVYNSDGMSICYLASSRASGLAAFYANAANCSSLPAQGRVRSVDPCSFRWLPILTAAMVKHHAGENSQIAEEVPDFYPDEDWPNMAMTGHQQP